MRRAQLRKNRLIFHQQSERMEQIFIALAQHPPKPLVRREDDLRR